MVLVNPYEGFMSAQPLGPSAGCSQREGVSMSRRVIVLLFMLVSTTTLMTAASTGATYDDGDRDGGDRVTDIDGYHRDEFDLDANLTVFFDAKVENGELTLSRTVFEDTFDDWQVAPWQIKEGNARIVGGTLETNSTQTANATVYIDIDRHDLELFLDVSPGTMQGWGPIITLMGASYNLTFRYNAMGNSLDLGYLEGRTFTSITSTTTTLITGEWYEVRFAVIGNEISLSLGPAILSATFSILGDFQTLELTSSIGDSAAWDNVTLKKVGGEGTAVSDPVTKPDDTFWDILQVSTYTPADTSITLSLLDASTQEPIPGLEDITRTITNIKGLIDPLNVTAVQLSVEMVTDTTQEPSLQFWKISWIGDPPRFFKPLPKATLNEDVPEEGVIDLRKHFVDVFTAPENLTYTVSENSEPGKVIPVADGYMLGFELPTKDWYGTATYTLTCSDGVLSVESSSAIVEVRPVDDAPVVSDWDQQETDENEWFVFNMTPYLSDVDTPIEDLRVRTTATHVTLDGQTLRVKYDSGGFLDRIVLEVFDRNNIVPVTLEITVHEVDDPPVFESLEILTINEDDEVTIDLEDKIEDEDTPLRWITLNLPDADKHIYSHGLNITLLYPTQTGEFLYTLEVSDGTSTVSQILEVRVFEVNDQPHVVSVDDMVPDEDDRVMVNVTEGVTRELLIAVEDEESTSFQYILVTDYDDAYMDGRYLVIPSKVGQIGTYDISVLITDIGGASTKVVVDLNIQNRNDPPIDVAITRPENRTSFREDEHINFSGYALDPDIPYGEILTYLWESDLDGQLGTGKNLQTPPLSLGTHRITLTVDDGEFNVSTWIELTVTKRDGGGGGGGGGGDDDDGGGLGLGMVLVIVVVLVVAVVGGVLFMRSKRVVEPTVVADASLSLDAPKEPKLPKPAEKPALKAAEKPKPAERPAVPAKAPAVKAPEAAPAEPTTKEPEVAVKPEPAPKAKPMVGETVRVGAHESFTLDTPVLSEEERALDELKRKYHNTIATLDFGIPSPELASRGWVDVAAALAVGEKKTLPDGREITEIDGRWYYSDIDNRKTFLKEHKE